LIHQRSGMSFPYSTKPVLNGPCRSTQRGRERRGKRRERMDM
jgi:hypothetical protein